LFEQRRAQRFELKLPVEVVRAGSVPVGTRGETCNLSSAGVLFSAELPVEVGEPIEYVITLPVVRNGDESVRLRCVGKVVRNERSTAAATLERYEFIHD
jgi:hypothetical protein